MSASRGQGGSATVRSASDPDEAPPRNDTWIRRSIHRSTDRRTIRAPRTLVRWMAKPPTPTASEVAPRGAPLALAVGGAVIMLLLPLPSLVLDVLLCAQLAAAVVVLWIAATAPAPSRLSGLPPALMALTLLRLALNVATTRAILSRAEAGAVIDAFGGAMVGGDLLVGLSVFAVVTIAQYGVVARGAGRVAEVAARFALDALPGRLQAIEGELRTGALDAEGARHRRQALDRTSGLYGAMDGVMRFVRGDALAGLCIVLVDIGGGLAIGIGRWGLDPDTALATYTMLTVGDGLASQVPAVLSTAAAAVLAIRLAAPEERGGPRPDLVRPLRIAAAIFGLLALMPGLPGWPLLGVAGAMAGLSWAVGRRPAAGALTADDAPLDGPALTLALHPDAFAALAGRSDAAIADARELARELGVVLPAVHISPAATDVPPSGYRITRAGVTLAEGLAPADRVFVCPCPEGRSGLGGHHPTNGAPGRWVEGGAGLQPAQVVAQHLVAVWARERAALGLQTVADRLQAIERRRPALVRAVVPRRLSLEALTTLLRRLLAEGLPIRDLVAVLEALAEQPETLPDGIPSTVEHRLAALRRARRRWLSARFARGPYLAVMHLGRELEAACAAGLIGIDGLRTALARIDAARAAHPHAVLVVADEGRADVRALLADHRPALPILSHGELDPALATRTIGFVTHE